MPLGIEISQEEMVALPSAVDNYIKCQLGIHCASHYMDDYVIIHHDLEQLKRIGREIIRRFERLGIPVNKRKCKLIPLAKPFKFCKAKFRLTETGKVIINRNRDSIKRARRKLKLFWHEWHHGKRSIFEIQHWFKGQIAYYNEYNDHGRVLRLRRLYYALFVLGGTRKCTKSLKAEPSSP